MYGTGEEWGVPDYVAAIDESLLSDLLAEFLDAPEEVVVEPQGSDIRLTLHRRVLVVENTDKNAAVRMRLQARVLPQHVRFLEQVADDGDEEAKDTGGVVPMVEFGIAAHVDSLVLKLTGWATGALELQDLELIVSVRLRLGHAGVFPDPVPASLAGDWEAIPASDDDTSLWGLQPHMTTAVGTVRAASSRRFVFGIRPGATFREWADSVTVEWLNKAHPYEEFLAQDVQLDANAQSLEGKSYPGVLSEIRTLLTTILTFPRVKGKAVSLPSLLRDELSVSWELDLADSEILPGLGLSPVGNEVGGDKFVVRNDLLALVKLLILIGISQGLRQQGVLLGLQWDLQAGGGLPWATYPLVPLVALPLNNVDPVRNAPAMGDGTVLAAAMRDRLTNIIFDQLGHFGVCRDGKLTDPVRREVPASLDALTDRGFLDLLLPAEVAWKVSPPPDGAVTGLLAFRFWSGMTVVRNFDVPGPDGTQGHLAPVGVELAGQPLTTGTFRGPAAGGAVCGVNQNSILSCLGLLLSHFLGIVHYYNSDKILTPPKIKVNKKQENIDIPNEDPIGKYLFLAKEHDLECFCKELKEESEDKKEEDLEASDYACPVQPTDEDPPNCPNWPGDWETCWRELGACSNVIDDPLEKCCWSRISALALERRPEFTALINSAIVLSPDSPAVLVPADASMAWRRFQLGNSEPDNAVWAISPEKVRVFHEKPEPAWGDPVTEVKVWIYDASTLVRVGGSKTGDPVESQGPGLEVRAQARVDIWADYAWWVDVATSPWASWLLLPLLPMPWRFLPGFSSKAENVKAATLFFLGFDPHEIEEKPFGARLFLDSAEGMPHVRVHIDWPDKIHNRVSDICAGLDFWTTVLLAPPAGFNLADVCVMSSEFGSVCGLTRQELVEAIMPGGNWEELDKELVVRDAFFPNKYVEASGLIKWRKTLDLLLNGDWRRLDSLIGDGELANPVVISDVSPGKILNTDLQQSLSDKKSIQKGKVDAFDLAKEEMLFNIEGEGFTGPLWVELTPSSTWQARKATPCSIRNHPTSTRLDVSVPWSLEYGRYDVRVVRLSDGASAVAEEAFKWVGVAIHAVEPSAVSYLEDLPVKVKVHGYDFKSKGLMVWIGDKKVENLVPATALSKVTDPREIEVDLGYLLPLLANKSDAVDAPLGEWIPVSVMVGEHGFTLDKALILAEKVVVGATPSPVCPTGIRSLTINGCGFFKYNDDSSETEKKEIPTVRIGGVDVNPTHMWMVPAAPFPSQGGTAGGFPQDQGMTEVAFQDNQHILKVPKNGRTIELDLPWGFLPPGEYPIEVEVKKRCPGWTAPSLEMIRFTDLQVVSVDPAELTFGQEAALTLRGSAFSPGCAFALVNEYGATVPLAGAEVMDATLVRIPAAVVKWPGWFDLAVTGPDGTEGVRLPKAVEVKQVVSPSVAQTVLRDLVAVGKPVALPSVLPFAGISCWPRADANLLPPLLEYETPPACIEKLSLCLSTMTIEGPGTAWLDVESNDECFSFFLKGGPGIDLYDLGTRPLSSIGNGFLWWARSILDQNTLPVLDGPWDRFGTDPSESIYVQPSPAFGGTEYPTMLAQRCMLVVQRDGKGELFRVGVLEFCYGDPAERVKWPRARFAMQWERNLLDVQPAYLKEVTLKASVSHESAWQPPPVSQLLMALEEPVYVPAYGRSPGADSKGHAVPSGHVAKPLDTKHDQRLTPSVASVGMFGLHKKVTTRVELTVQCAGTAVPKVDWFWVPDGSAAELPFDPNDEDLSGADWGAHFGTAPFHVLSWDPPIEPLEEPEPPPGQMPSFSPRFQYKLVLLGPVAAPKVKGQFFCRVTSEWGDFDMTSNPVEVEFVSELTTDLSHKKVVSQKQFPTPGDFGLGDAGPGGLPPGWQEMPKEATQWMGPGEDPVPTDMQKNMQENLDPVPVPGKGSMGV